MLHNFNNNTNSYSNAPQRKNFQSNAPQCKKKKIVSLKETQKAFKTRWTQSKQRAISYSNQVVNQNKRIKVDKPVKQTNHHQQTKQINQLKQVNPDYHSSSKLLQF